jgi:hypothetical protein
VYRLRTLGFLPQTVFPVHYHGLSPAVKSDHHEFHSRLAQAVADIGIGDQRLVPFCSSFVLEVRKDA